MVFRPRFVVVVDFLYLQYYSTVQYSSVLLYMCSKQEHKADHGHKKGHAPRALCGHSSTGISRPCTKVLRTRTYSFAANTLLRSRASRRHLNLYPLYLNGKSTVVRSWWSSFFCTYSLQCSSVVHVQ